MSTLGDMKSRIYLEIHQTMSTEVQNACIDAVLHYQSTRFWFNEKSVNFNLSLTTQYALSIIPDVYSIDTFKIWSGGTPYLISRASWNDLEKWDYETASASTPTDYAIHHEILRIYPKPSTTLSAQVNYMKAITMSASNSSSTVWTNEAQDLIRHRAKALIYAQVLLETQMAQDEAVMEGQALTRLLSRTTKLTSSGKVKGYL